MSMNINNIDKPLLILSSVAAGAAIYFIILMLLFNAPTFEEALLFSIVGYFGFRGMRNKQARDTK